MSVLHSFSSDQAPSLVATIRRFFPEVDRVADGTKHVTVSVTSKDCSSAKERSFNRCAMAKACERQLHLDGAVIRPGVAYLVKGNLAVRYLVPDSVRTEIVSFDRHGDFRPGDYTLSPICKSNRIGAPRATKKEIRLGRHSGNGVRPRGKTVGIRTLAIGDMS